MKDFPVIGDACTVALDVTMLHHSTKHQYLIRMKQKSERFTETSFEVLEVLVRPGKPYAFDCLNLERYIAILLITLTVLVYMLCYACLYACVCMVLSVWGCNYNDYNNDINRSYHDLCGWIKVTSSVLYCLIFLHSMYVIIQVHYNYSSNTEHLGM